MGIGSKIKERKDALALTTEELALRCGVEKEVIENLESDLGEFNDSLLEKLSNALNYPFDKEINKSNTYDEEKKEFNNFGEVRSVLTICEVCNEPLYNKDSIKRYQYKVSVDSGRHSHYEERSKVLCVECYNEQIKSDEKKRLKALQEEKDHEKKKRIGSYFLSTIALIIVLALGNKVLRSGNAGNIALLILCSIMAFTLVGCIMIDKTWVSEIFFDIVKFGFKGPGIIFTLNLDGFIFLITMKLLFFLIGIALTLISLVIAIFICAPFSIFAYPFEIKASLKVDQKM